MNKELAVVDQEKCLRDEEKEEYKELDIAMWKRVVKEVDKREVPSKEDNWNRSFELAKQYIHKILNNILAKKFELTFPVSTHIFPTKISPNYLLVIFFSTKI